MRKIKLIRNNKIWSKMWKTKSFTNFNRNGSQNIEITVKKLYGPKTKFYQKIKISPKNRNFGQFLTKFKLNYSVVLNQ